MQESTSCYDISLTSQTLTSCKGSGQTQTCSAQSAIFTRARAVMAFDDIARSQNNTRKTYLFLRAAHDACMHSARKFCAHGRHFLVM